MADPLKCDDDTFSFVFHTIFTRLRKSSVVAVAVVVCLEIKYEIYFRENGILKTPVCVCIVCHCH